MSRTLFTIFIFLAFQFVHAQDCDFDSIPPTLQVKSELFINGDDIFQFTLNAASFDDGTFDNCTEKESLRFSFSSNRFDNSRYYNEIPTRGVELEIWVTDEQGNQSSQVVRLNRTADNCTEDTQPPNGYRNKYVNLFPGDPNAESLTILAEHHQIHFFDNCTKKNNLSYSFSGDSFVPEMVIPMVINSATEVELWVSDEAGNQMSLPLIIILRSVNEPDNCTFEANISSQLDCENNTASIITDVPEDTPPYTYNWSNGSVNKNLIDVPFGNYHVIIANGKGCSRIERITIGAISKGAQIHKPCKESRVQFGFQEGTEPYTYTWNDGFTTTESSRIVPIGKDYKVTIVDANGCEDTAEMHLHPCSLRPENTLFVDEDLDCELGETERIIQFPSNDDVLIELVKDKVFDTDLIRLENFGGENIIGPSFTEANYVEGLAVWSFQGFDGGEFTYHIYRVPELATEYQFIKITSRFATNCEPTYIPINVPYELVLDEILLPIGTSDECIQLETSLSTPFLRRCFPNKYDINYCNYSISTIEEVYLELELDEYLTLLSSPVDYTDLGENKYRFDLGALEAGECGKFSLEIEVSCEAVLGQTHCSQVQIFPESTCDEPDANWSGASLEVDGTCDGEEVTFKITNVGNGNMDSASDYVVVEDVVMFSRDNFQLNTGEFMEIKTPANGSTYRINVDQVEGHPGNSFPTVAIEGCGTNEQGSVSLGFVNQFPENDVDRNKDIDCQENIGSYDPNDKLAIPSGIGENHLIEENTDIEYTIRFQNTGTDTAFTVVVLDSLSSVLDPSTIQLMSGSHPYQFDLLQGNIMRFRFDSILLPDSTTNEPASNGYVRFKISQDSNLVDGTIIENSAAIYFDFNEPIITNTYFHVVGFELAQTVNTINEKSIVSELATAYPNPFNEKTLIRINAESQQVQLELFDMLGAKVWEKQIYTSEYLFDRSTLDAGLYFLKITTKQDLTELIKLIIIE